MAPAPDRPTWAAAFSAPARCCTYHPRLANYLVGRGLRRGGVGADRLLARIGDRDGVEPLGIVPGRRWIAQLRAAGAGAFGVDERLTCPYWVGGERACSIHPDRDAVCRTWHCRIAHGARGYRAWTALNVALFRLEQRLAERCARAVPHPEPAPGADALTDAAIAAFYVACAEHVDALPPAERAALRDGLAPLGAKVAAAAEARDVPMPDVVHPTLHDWWRIPDPDGPGSTVLVSFSPYDPFLGPPWVFALLARLDGVRPWTDAADATAAEVGVASEVVRALVVELWSRGLLGVPEVLEDGPEPTWPDGAI